MSLDVLNQLTLVDSTIVSFADFASGTVDVEGGSVGILDGSAFEFGVENVGTLGRLSIRSTRGNILFADSTIGPLSTNVGILQRSGAAVVEISSTGDLDVRNSRFESRSIDEATEGASYTLTGLNVAVDNTTMDLLTDLGYAPGGKHQCRRHRCSRPQPHVDRVDDGLPPSAATFRSRRGTRSSFRGGTEILADAAGGTGGTIQLNTPSLIPDLERVSPAILESADFVRGVSGARISATSGTGTPGTVEANPPEVNLESQAAALEVSFLPQEGIQSVCAARASGVGGSFQVARYQGLPTSPEDLLLAFDDFVDADLPMVASAREEADARPHPQVLAGQQALREGDAENCSRPLRRGRGGSGRGAGPRVLERCAAGPWPGAAARGALWGGRDGLPSRPCPGPRG